MLAEILADVALVVHGPKPPSSDDWDAFLDAAAALLPKRPDFVPVLVLTDGGRPSAAQREAMNRITPRNGVLCAVATGSAVARGAVSILSWFNPHIRAFPPGALRDALAYLELDASRYDDVLARVARMRMQLASGPHRIEHVRAERAADHVYVVPRGPEALVVGDRDPPAAREQQRHQPGLPVEAARQQP